MNDIHRRDKSQACNQDEKSEKQYPDAGERDFTLTREEARGGSPADASVGGEEDAGVGLEFVVRKDEVGDLARHLQREKQELEARKAKAEKAQPAHSDSDRPPKK